MSNKKHVLLINLGSPKSLAIDDVRSYLKEFLSDRCVIDLPRFLQQLILRCFILPFRPRKTKEAYELVWKDGNSPLVANTKKIAEGLEAKTGWSVDVAMRYQEPSIQEAIETFKKKNITDVVIVPLYPHNAMSTTVTTEDEVKRIVKECYPELSVTFVKPFYDNEQYVNALASSIQSFLSVEPDRVIFSYHGIPERHVRKSDPTEGHCLESDNCCEIDCLASRNCYRSNVYTATSKVAKKLHLKPQQWLLTFQSRVTLIDPKWLRPYTDKVLEVLPSQGIKNIVIVCPSFVADCLETLEEIDIRGRKTFLEAGGVNFTWVPCMNASAEFIACLETIICDSHPTS